MAQIFRGVGECRVYMDDLKVRVSSSSNNKAEYIVYETVVDQK